jgi:hypothetical protein
MEKEKKQDEPEHLVIPEKSKSAQKKRHIKG